MQKACWLLLWSNSYKVTPVTPAYAKFLPVGIASRNFVAVAPKQQPTGICRRNWRHFVAIAYWFLLCSCDRRSRPIGKNSKAIALLKVKTTKQQPSVALPVGFDFVVAISASQYRDFVAVAYWFLLCSCDRRSRPIGKNSKATANR